MPATSLAVPRAIRVVDSHTEGEPTRVVIDGWPEPGGATMAERRAAVRDGNDALRRAVICEPRGHDAMVGALLTSPVREGSAAGVIFFDNVTYLGMCGHGSIGVVRTLAHLGRVGPGSLSLDTPAGTIRAELAPDLSVTIENVPAFLHARDVAVSVPGAGSAVGDVAYGGNWFFITRLPLSIRMENLSELEHATTGIREALRRSGITGADGAEIDHVVILGPPGRADADSRNFVMCPGGAYDRSPCGTGTSATMAALHARGDLAIGAVWRQESVTGGLFEGWLSIRGEQIVPHIRGRAYITGESTLRFDPLDPFRLGLPAG